MQPIRLFGVAVLTLVLMWQCERTPVQVDQQRVSSPLDDRMRYLIQWISLHSNYTANQNLPNVQYMQPEKIDTLFKPKTPQGYQVNGTIFAVYDHLRKTIVLPTTFDLHSDEPYLAHELVHFLQYEEGRTYLCPAERERDAYTLQREYALETGIGDPPALEFIATLHCPRPSPYEH